MVMPEDTVLIVEDEPSARLLLGEFLGNRGIRVYPASNCAEAEQLCRAQRPDAVVLDFELPDGTALDLIPRLRGLDSALPMILLSGHGSIERAVQAMKEGAEQFLTKPADLEALLLILLRCIRNRRERQVQLADKSRMERNQYNPFLGSSKRITSLKEIATRVLQTSSPILIQGETGTGKGVLARWLHQNGPRRSCPFVDLNCAGLSRELMETELFGHEKGSFTGAFQAKTGLLEVGHKGVLFLDEIGDLDISVQPKLLKVLEDKTFRRLGDVRERTVDVQLIAASHRNLQELVRKNKFRDDLYFRINTIYLDVPPLRERQEDIPVLAADILERIGVRSGIPHTEIAPDAMDALVAYSWPGNVRELRNILERAVLLGERGKLSVRDVQFDTRIPGVRKASPSFRTLEEVERDYIKEVLSAVSGQVSEAATRLGMPRSSLYNKIKQYGLGKTSESPDCDEQPLVLH
jgi:DNA-binding NtrC family response regulator